MKPYGCHSRPRKDGYWASEGTYNRDDLRIQLAVWIEDVMSKECQYRKTTFDERCKGCTCP